ncbi:MAG: hypothetical protein F6K55_28465 [Moorea sp. SIO4A3]|nr:hypothetical protein [Moorena sp. SIO4A3]
MSQPHGEVEPIVGETVTSSVAVEELESGVGEEVQEVVRSLQHSESVPVAATSEEKLEVNNEALLRGGMNRSGVGILPARKLKQARCLFHQDACSTKMAISPRCPFHQYGHSTARCPPQKTIKIIPHLYNAIAGLSFLITICSNFHPVKLTGRPCLIME